MCTSGSSSATNSSHVFSSSRKIVRDLRFGSESSRRPEEAVFSTYGCGDLEGRLNERHAGYRALSDLSGA